MSAPDVVLVDAGGTNIGSVRYALERLGIDASVTHNEARIRSASHVILPGVGAAGPAMRKLESHGLVDVVRGLKQPVLGVCLGMQLLFEHSEESDTSCLGVIPGQVRRIPVAPACRVPHMGWNRLDVLREDPLLRELPEKSFAYFVHSYAVTSETHALATSGHGTVLAAVVREKNFCGMQFHPERSAAVGARLLENFLSL
ncbi:imidazole glycerol phosphate synthase subunit HisH [Dokdonella sp.]|uniref:imidazole glycerol phosphate synthase subunit HisH n=1 Tax=Dokdonella sp. TaxID=2291710 RepID=UPI003C4FF426